MANDADLLTEPGGPLDPAAWRAQVEVFFSEATGRIYLLGDDPAAPWIVEGHHVTRGDRWPPEGEGDLLPLCVVPARVESPEGLPGRLAASAVLPRDWRQLGTWHGAVQADHQLRKAQRTSPPDVLSLSEWARPILDAAAERVVADLAEHLRGAIEGGDEAARPEPTED